MEFFLVYMCIIYMLYMYISSLCVCAKSLQWCSTLCNPQTVACQAPLSMGFSRQEYWSGLPYPPPGDLPDPGIEPVPLMSPALIGGFFTTSATWEAPYILYTVWYISNLFKHNNTWNFKYNKILNPDRKVFESLLLEYDQCFGISCANLCRQLKMI